MNDHFAELASLPILHVAAAPQEVAPDGSTVRPLLRFPGASLAQFNLAAGLMTKRVTHKAVDELWYVQEGEGELWLQIQGRETLIRLVPGLCVRIPRGSVFQFRALGESLSILGVTLPAWSDAAGAQCVPGSTW
jgi:mannose-6-phosphate isomerase-like protein (cupin superfamily)